MHSLIVFVFGEKYRMYWCLSVLALAFVVAMTVTGIDQEAHKALPGGIIVVAITTMFWLWCAAKKYVLWHLNRSSGYSEK